MLKGLIVLIVSVLGWASALWFFIKPDFSKWSHPGLLSLHVLPALAILGIWYGITRYLQKRKITQTTEREAKAEAERQAKLEAARSAHEEETRQLQYGCDCRALALAQVVQADPDKPLFEPNDSTLILSQFDTEAIEEEAPEDLLDHLRSAIYEALLGVYSASSAALEFPIYIAPPAEFAGEVLFQEIRELHRQLREELGATQCNATAAIYFLPGSNCIANSTIVLFENTPDLPGAVLLGFDSPKTRLSPDDMDGDAEEPTPQQKQHGQPSQAVVAMLLTHADLPAMIASLPIREESEDNNDSMTPYWQRTDFPTGNLGLLARSSKEQCDELAELPVLARIHRAASASLGNTKNRSQEIIRSIRALLERAQIKAALIDRPFLTPEVEEAKADEAPPCAWLVHNAGSVSHAGQRLAALGAAMYQQGIDVDPIDCGTNLAVELGDCGRATPLTQLATTIAQSALNAAPALCAEFSGEDQLAVFFATPQEDKA